jgi:hypothetical protein
MICKKDGLEKMKIEKIGEKKEGFLEKLGECYSISTKNGTLPKKAKHRFCLYPRMVSTASLSYTD